MVYLSEIAMIRVFGQCSLPTDFACCCI